VKPSTAIRRRGQDGSRLIYYLKGLNTLKTLNSAFTLAHPVDYEPDSGRVVLRCHSAKALLALPPYIKVKINPPRAQHLPPSGVLTNRGQDVALLSTNSRELLKWHY